MDGCEFCNVGFRCKLCKLTSEFANAKYFQCFSHYHMYYHYRVVQHCDLLFHTDIIRVCKWTFQVFQSHALSPVCSFHYHLYAAFTRVVQTSELLINIHTKIHKHWSNCMQDLNTQTESNWQGSIYSSLSRSANNIALKWWYCIWRTRAGLFTLKISKHYCVYANTAFDEPDILFHQKTAAEVLCWWVDVLCPHSGNGSLCNPRISKLLNLDHINHYRLYMES